MAKRSGRRSAADISAAKFTGSLQPTRKLSPAESQYWKLVVNAWPGSHFIASDAILLTQLAAVSAAFDAAADLGDLSAMTKASRLAMSLATRLRITVQSRYDEKSASRQAGLGRGNEVVKRYGKLIASAPSYSRSAN